MDVVGVAATARLIGLCIRSLRERRSAFVYVGSRAAAALAVDHRYLTRDVSVELRGA